MAQQQDETKQHEEKVQELEEYIRIQEDYFVEQITETELQTFDIREAHEKEKECLNLVNVDLTRICTKLEVKYEKKRLELLVAETKLITKQVSAEACITKLRKELATTHYPPANL